MEYFLHVIAVPMSTLILALAAYLQSRANRIRQEQIQRTLNGTLEATTLMASDAAYQRGFRDAHASMAEATATAVAVGVAAYKKVDTDSKTTSGGGASRSPAT